MFDPEHKDIDCPKCLRRRVYFDREIGCYCMFCGHVLSVEETLLQMKKRAATPTTTGGSDKKTSIPIVDIEDGRSRSTETDRSEQRLGPKQDEKPQ